ncbi:MAG TPA: ABC transporter permease [Jiangellales bacterium]|nr:ABC transporter permease [Jiangellales bacterium]
MTRPLSTREAVTTVARREFVERARDRSFLVSTGVTLAIIGAVIALPQLIGLDDTSYRVAVAGESAPTVEAAARTQADLADVTVEVLGAPDVTEARQLVEDGDLDALLDGTSVVVRQELPAQLRVVLDNAYRAAAGDAALVAAGLDPAQVGQALAVPPLQVEALDPDAEAARTRGQVAFVGALILYGQLLGYGFWVALGVVEEKSSRVVELLLSAIPARALLAGKVVGIGLLGLFQLLVVAVGGVGVAAATGALTIDAAVVEPVLIVLAWFVLGYTAYACLMAAAAARVSRQEELQNATTPVSTLAIVSFLATFYVAANPDAVLSRVLAVTPPISALTMPVRSARGDAAAWEVPLAVGLMLGLIVLLVVVAGRVYEGAVLRTGRKVPLADAWRAGRRGR